MKSPEETAILVAASFLKAGLNRIRLSDVQLRSFSGWPAKHRSNFVFALKMSLDMYGISLIELRLGGYGLFRHKALEAAPTWKPAIFNPEGIPSLDQAKDFLKSNFGELE